MPASVSTLILSLVLGICSPTGLRIELSSWAFICHWAVHLSGIHSLVWRAHLWESRDVGSVWLQMLYLWDFEEVMGILAGLEFGHRYYIRETLTKLMGALVWLKAWWIFLSVKQATDQKSMQLLPYRRGNARKSRDFGSVWPQILYLWDFEEPDRCLGLAQGLVDRSQTRNPCCWCITGDEMPTKVMILAQFEVGYYIRGILKRLTDDVDWLKAWWSCGGKVVIVAKFGHGYYIRGTLKRLTDDVD
ncbi:hypothetical protein C8R44DRAFT_745047 [Mycena epipterygia]|nr:hypothetical protein C8R44DRAFT_745047 [Mycena epipterygia]